MSDLDHLARTLGVAFRDPQLLRGALLHRSFVNEHPGEAAGMPSNERLEFLGDAVLNFLCADLLYRRFPERGEGELTTMRSALVKTATLAGFAQQFQLDKQVLISMGGESDHARRRPALLADVFEAVLGAIYLDRGLEAARAFAVPLLEQALAQGAPIDYKTLLQERVQAQSGITPHYRITQVSGPDHRREYTVEVVADDQVLGVGTGSSKQAATQQAAQQALQEG